jgi:hypothetical protein
MLRQSGQTVNRSGFIRAGIKEVGLRWGAGNIPEDELGLRPNGPRARPVEITKFRLVQTSGDTILKAWARMTG